MSIKIKKFLLRGLRAVSRVMGINLSYFLKHGFWVVVRYICIGILGILFTAGFAHLSSKELFGSYQYVLSVLALFSIFSLPGLNVVALREVARGQHGVIVRAVRESFQWSWVAVPFILAYGMYNIISGQGALGWSFVVASFLFPFFYAPNTWTVFYEGQSLFRPVTVRVILSTAVVYAMIIFGLWGHLDLPWVVGIFLAASAFFGWIYYREIQKKTSRVSPLIDMRYGLSCTAQKFTYSMTGALPQIIIGSLFGLASVAIYQVAYFSTTFITGFIVALSSTYMPLLFKYTSLRRSGHIVGINLALGVILFLGYCVLLRIFFLFFFGEAYYVSYVLAWIFSWHIMLIPLRVFLINIFTAKGKNTLIIWANVLANIIAPILMYAVKDFGFLFAVGTYYYAVNLIFMSALICYYIWCPQDERAYLRDSSDDSRLLTE